MQIRLRTLTLRIDWLMLLFPCLALLLDCGRQTALLMLSLFLHEFSHWGAARLLRVGMSSIRLTPFGGLAHLDNPYSVSPSRLCAIAAAGPLANLALILIATFLLQWTPAPRLFVLELISVNAILMLFNLLPALPLDGGRMLYAILSRFISERIALNLCLWTGRILAVFLLFIALAGLILYGRFNLSFPLAAVFILASAGDERRALSDSKARALLNSIRPITDPVPVEIIAVSSTASPQSALSAARPNRVTLFAIYDHGHLREITDDRTLLKRMLEAQSAPASNIR